MTAIFKGKTQCVLSYQSVELNVFLGFKVSCIRQFRLRTLCNWSLQTQEASNAKRALINLIGGKKRKPLYLEVADSEALSLQPVDLYVPDIIGYSEELELTYHGERCLHVNKAMSWLFDRDFNHDLVLDILKAKKRLKG